MHLRQKKETLGLSNQDKTQIEEQELKLLKHCKKSKT
jgi:hypothetical protein